MSIKKYFIAALSFCSINNINAQTKPSKIIIEGEVPPGYKEEYVSFLSTVMGPLVYKEMEMKTTKAAAREGFVKWEMQEEKPVSVNSPILNINNYLPWLAIPGDSLSIKYHNGQPVFSGKGAEMVTLIYLLKNAEDSLRRFRSELTSSNITTSSLQDYLGWHSFLKTKADAMFPMIEAYKLKLPRAQYDYIKYEIEKEIVRRRIIKFNQLRLNPDKTEKNKYGLTNVDLCNIFDTTLNTTTTWSIFRINSFDSDLFYQWTMLKLMLYRERGRFFKTSKTEPNILGNDEEDPYLLQYDLAKRKFKGIYCEKLMAFAFWDHDGLFRQVGFTPKVDSLLRDYYKQPGYQDHKAMVKRLEIKARENYTKTVIIPFSVTDVDKKPFTSKQLSGKLSVLEFWYTGCKGCNDMKASLERVEHYFKNDDHVAFVKISTDKNFDVWKNSLSQGKYIAGSGLHLFTSGKGANHEIIKDFDIASYPTLFLIDQAGGIIPYDRNTTDPRIDSGKALINLIQKELALSKDGPYIFYQGTDSLVSWSITGVTASRNVLEKTGDHILKAYTDDHMPFNIQLKSKLDIEPSEFKRPSELLVFSDIEGNFKALKELLVSNGVIDNNFNWTFGKGHLVFAGDMFDRGKQVTECLWLIYSLEEKAKQSGGYVHFVLGNHEIMNMQGQDKYVQQKYHSSAKLIGLSIKELYDSDSELGRWLRTKNVVERIGNLLIAHGGFSSAINKLSLTISEINKLSRPYYDQSSKDIKDSTAKILMHTILGPFWYRAYYQGKTLATMTQVDSTLAKFNADHIITGHTIIADTISVLYDKKVINTDTKHAEGKSEALYIKEDHFYRVNSKGNRILLFIDKKKVA